MNPSSLLAIETNSTAFAYKLLGEMSQNEWLEVVEISSAANGKNFLLVQAESFVQLKKLLSRIEEKYGRASKKWHEISDPQILDVSLIENADPEILPAMISLVQNPVEEALLVLECPSICGILSALQSALSEFGLKICDLRLMRQSGGICQAFLTGENAKCQAASPVFRQKFLAEYRPNQVECIENLSPKLREFFKF